MYTQITRLLLSPERNRVALGAILPLRLFLGMTFVYAGIAKLTDPQFFSPSAPGYIGAQMNGFVHAGSPLSWMIVHVALPQATLFGASIALAELLIGISALLGLLSRPGALGGLSISMTFYLTASWTVHPYFLGADLPYAMGWLTLLLAGPGRYSLDEVFMGLAVRPLRSPAPYPMPVNPSAVARGAFLRVVRSAGLIAMGGMVFGGLLKWRTPSAAVAEVALPPARSAVVPAAGDTLLGNVGAVAMNQAASYTDPVSGDPALLVRLSSGQFVAYDAVCPHAGCTVGYDPARGLFACPCHGGLFDPTHAGAVLGGPAPSPLTQLPIRVDSKGNVFSTTGGATASTSAQAAAQPAPIVTPPPMK